MGKESEISETFEEQFQRLNRSEKTVDLVVEYASLLEGQHVVGILIGIEEVQNAKITEPCKRYIIETDNGPVSVLPGSATDKQVEGKVKIGLLTYIEFKGKIEINGGAKMLNRYIFKQAALVADAEIENIAKEAIEDEQVK